MRGGAVTNMEDEMNDDMTAKKQENGGPPAIPDGYMMDAKGRFVPEHLIGLVFHWWFLHYQF